MTQFIRIGEVLYRTLVAIANSLVFIEPTHLHLHGIVFKYSHSSIIFHQQKYNVTVLMYAPCLHVELSCHLCELLVSKHRVFFINSNGALDP